MSRTEINVPQTEFSSENNETLSALKMALLALAFDPDLADYY